MVVTAASYLLPNSRQWLSGSSLRRLLGESQQFLKKSGLIEDSPEAMEATNEDALAQNIKDKNI